MAEADTAPQSEEVTLKKGASVRDHLEAATKESQTRAANIERGALAAKEPKEPPEKKDPPSKLAAETKPAAEVKPSSKPKSETEPVDKGSAKSHSEAQTSKSGETPQGSAAPDQATTGPAAPQSWSREHHDGWKSLSPELKDHILKREKQMEDGVVKIKEQYRELDEAIAPYRPIIQQYGQTAGKTVRQLFEWNMALAGPHKVEAFRQLSQRFNIDLGQLVPKASPAGKPGEIPAGATDNPLVSEFATLKERQDRLEAQAREDAARVAENARVQAERTVQTWAADKPHFERVRYLMFDLVGADTQLVNAGQPSRYNIVKADGSVDLDEAYKRACRLDDGLQSELEAERAQKAAVEAAAEAQRKEAEAKARAEAKAKADAEEAERARRAGTSIKPGAPSRSMAQAPAAPQKGESVRDALRRSIASLSQGSRA